MDPPPIDIIDLDGFQSYFREVVSPTDRGMLAAAIYLDLVPEDLGERFPQFENLQPIPVGFVDTVNGTGLHDRHQIPAVFEPRIYELAGGTDNPLGVRVNPPLEIPDGVGPGQPIQTVGDMYARIYHYGALRYTDWLNGTGPGPRDHDLDVMLQSVDAFAKLQPFQGQTPFVRAQFAAAVQQTLYQDVTGQPFGQFTTYGNAALSQFLPKGVVVPPVP